MYTSLVLSMLYHTPLSSKHAPRVSHEHHLLTTYDVDP